MWELVFTKQAQKDARKLTPAGLRDKAETLLEILRQKSVSKSAALREIIR